MPSGTVKWFNNAKGYGFILSSDGVSDVFAHYSAINMEGYKTLKAGQEVSFDLAEGQKGLDRMTASAPISARILAMALRLSLSTKRLIFMLLLPH